MAQIEPSQSCVYRNNQNEKANHNLSYGFVYVPKFPLFSGYVCDDRVNLGLVFSFLVLDNLNYKGYSYKKFRTNIGS